MKVHLGYSTEDRFDYFTRVYRTECQMATKKRRHVSRSWKNVDCKKCLRRKR